MNTTKNRKKFNLEVTFFIYNPETLEKIEYHRRLHSLWYMGPTITII